VWRTISTHWPGPKGLGGLDALIGRADANLAVLAGWVEHTPWIDFLASAPATRSNTSVCLSFTDPAITALDGDAQATFAKAVAGRLDVEGVAYDIGSYRDAPPGLRIWAGATVEADDLEALTAWIDWAYEAEKAALAAG
jgi:phosphoserine aminotransferase